MSRDSDDVFGFVLVTIDPLLARRNDEIGRACDLVRARLERKTWPMFERTGNRKRLFVGAPLAFYVGGHKEHGGEVIAFGEIAGIRPRRPGASSVDPEDFVPDSPDLILD